DDRPPRRVRVTRSTPYGRQPGRPRPTPPTPAAPADEVTRVYDAGLRRALLRWAAVTLAVVALPLFGWPLAVLVVPGLGRAAVAGVPLPWLLLGVGVYPLVWLASRWYVAGAERTERDYRDAVEGAG
ncbi:MAG: hypothetical protein ACFCVF_16215, partial [Kineosporiaceae bacterium]